MQSIASPTGENNINLEPRSLHDVPTFAVVEPTTGAGLVSDAVDQTPSWTGVMEPPAEASASVAPPPQGALSWVPIVKVEVDPGAEATEQHAAVPAAIVVTWDGGQYEFEAPTMAEHNPPDWWFVETFTGIASERVAKSWDGNDNPPLHDAGLKLHALMKGTTLPVNSDAEVDLAAWRRSLVQARFASGHKPFLFLHRPDQNVERTRALFGDAAGPHAFRFGAEHGRSRGRPALIMGVDGVPNLRRLDDEAALRTALNQFIRFARPGRPPRPMNPPREMLATLMAFPDPSWPPIRGVVRVPSLRADGSVLDVPGYDRQSEVWYSPELKIEHVPESPTAADVERARATIREPFDEFPWASAGSYAGAVACLLDQVVLALIDGPRPLFAFVAPPRATGSGKSLLPKMISLFITGAKLPPGALPTREEEVEKRLQALLLTGDPMFCFDNIKHRLDSPALELLLTSEVWRGRTLGASSSPVLPNRATWMATMNGGSWSRDLARRTVTVELDTGLADANQRTFRIEAEPWALANRGRVIHALLVCARAWVTAGRPRDPTLKLGGFERWAAVVGGILHHVGIHGLASAVASSSARDTESREYERLVAAWLDRFGERRVTAREVGALALEAELFRAKLADAAHDRQRLGLAAADALDAVIDRPIGAHVVRRKARGLPDKSTAYWLEPLPTPTTP